MWEFFSVLESMSPGRPFQEAYHYLVQFHQFWDSQLGLLFIHFIQLRCVDWILTMVCKAQEHQNTKFLCVEPYLAASWIFCNTRLEWFGCITWFLTWGIFEFRRDLITWKPQPVWRGSLFRSRLPTQGSFTAKKFLHLALSPFVSGVGGQFAPS